MASAHVPTPVRYDMQHNSLSNYQKQHTTKNNNRHAHINPHQIQFLDPAALAPGNRYTDYFEAGDWHDTLVLPMRFQVRRALFFGLFAELAAGVGREGSSTAVLPPRTLHPR
jgi:hypothetical protein